MISVLTLCSKSTHSSNLVTVIGLIDVAGDPNAGRADIHYTLDGTGMGMDTCTLNFKVFIHV